MHCEPWGISPQKQPSHLWLYHAVISYLKKVVRWGLCFIVEGTGLHIWGNFCVTLKMIMEVSWSSPFSWEKPRSNGTQFNKRYILSTRMAVGDARSGKREVEVEVETDCDEGYIWHLSLHRNKRLTSGRLYVAEGTWIAPSLTALVRYPHREDYLGCCSQLKLKR